MAIEGGRKYDHDKLRWDLLPTSEMKKIVDILTLGAHKYADNNWKSVTPFKKRYYAAMMRHLSAWEQGEKYDEETKRSHLNHAATNLVFLMWGEDNLFNAENLRIAYDIDGVLADFTKAASKMFNLNHSQWWKYSFKLDNGDMWDKLDKNKDFWLNIEPLIKAEDIPYEPKVYITARHHKGWTEEWLEKNNFPCRSVIQVKGTKKEALIENKIDVLIDDKLEYYLEAKSIGIKAFLRTQPSNARYDVGYDRINCLSELKNKL